MKANRARTETAVGRSERFERFQEIVFGSRNARELSGIETQMLSRNLNMVRRAAVVVFLTNAFWLVKDIVDGGLMNLNSGLALGTILITLLSSCFVFALPKLAQDHSFRWVEFSILAYYIILLGSVTVLGMTKNVQMLSVGTEYRLAGLPLSTCYLFILILAPLPSIRDTVILGVAFFVAMFLPAFLPGHEMYSLPQQFIIRSCMAVAYWVNRETNRALADSIQQLSLQSFTDPLTDTLNRRALDIFWTSINQKRAVEYAGVLVLDIDDFKLYNDCYSHAKGDDVLRDVCGVVSGVVTGQDSFLFRFGGEEFVVLLMNPTEQSMLRCAESIRDAVYDFNIRRDDGSRFNRITITVGCAIARIDGTPEQNCIVNADLQLYIGKNNGKDCVVFKDTIHRRQDHAIEVS